MDEYEEFISYGGAIKATKMEDGSVKFYGPVITFSDSLSPDLEGDFFTKETDYGDSDKADVYFNHRMPISAGGNTIQYKNKLGKARLIRDDAAIFAETIIKARNEYEKMIVDAGLAGRLGYSSGTASHLVDRVKSGNANHVQKWTLGDDVSLTPIPAEPRNAVIALKSYQGGELTAISEGEPEAVKAGSEEAESTQTLLKGEIKMDEKKEITPEIQAILDAQSESMKSAVKEAAEQAVKAFRESEPATKKADLVVTKDESEQPFENAGAFFMAVKNAGVNPMHTDQKLFSLKSTGLNETIPSYGGFLVPPEYAAGLLENTWKQGTLLSQFPRMQIQGNRMIYNINDETSRADGSRWGGVQGYWLGEGATKTASKPSFRQLDLKLNKLAALVYATDELLEDTTALESWLYRTVPNELRFNVENAIINGNGVGKPLGILNSAALVSFARVDASEIDATDIGTMWSRRLSGLDDYIWLGNQSIFPQMLNLSIGNYPVFLPPSGMSGLPYATLLGRPYFDTEYNPVLGDPGDLMLVSPSAYPIIEKASGIKADSSIHVAFTADESVFRFVYRIDGGSMYESAITGYDTNTYSPFVCLTSSS